MTGNPEKQTSQTIFRNSRLGNTGISAWLNDVKTSLRRTIGALPLLVKHVRSERAPTLKGSLQRQTFEWLPESFQHRLMRSHLNLDHSYPEDITFKIVESMEEIERACSLLHEAYAEVGFTNINGSGSRFTVYHAMPTSYTLIAKQGDDILATGTLIVRTTDPLPAEDMLALEKYLKEGRRLVEVSALAIHRRARGNEGRILFSFFKYGYTFALRHLGATDLIFTCVPAQFAFYTGILLFEPIDGKVVHTNDRVNGAPAVAARLDLLTWPERLKRIYGGRPAHRNMYDYMVQNEYQQFNIPERAASLDSGNRWSLEDLSWLMKNRAHSGSAFKLSDVAKLRRAYGKEYASLFDHYCEENGLGSLPA